MTGSPAIAPEGQPPRLRLFSSPPGAPRSRRTVDWFTFGVAIGTFVLAGWAAHGELSLDARVRLALVNLPGWVEFLARGVFVGCGLVALVLLVSVVVVGRDRRIARDLLVAIALLVLLVVVASRLTVGQWPDLFPEYIDPGTPSFPNLRIALLTVLVTTPAPHLTAPIRRLGRFIVAASAVSGVVLGIVTVTGVTGGIAIGIGIGALVHVVFGSPAGLPSVDRIEAALADLGLGEVAVELFEDQPVGAALASGHGADGRRFLIRIYGRDAADAQLASKLWRSLWYRDSGPAPSLTGMQQVEHEAVVALLAERSGASVEHVVVAGHDADDNAFLVLRQPADRSLAAPGGEVTDRDVDATWAALRSLHRAGVVHGSIRPETVILDDGSARLIDLSRASLWRRDGRTETDTVSMLASLACVLGAERAAASARRCLTHDEIEAALPYMQDAVLNPELRRELRRHSSLDELGDIVTAELGLEPPELAEVRRVKPLDVVIVVFGILAATAIVSQIAEIGLDRLLEEVGNASAGWLLTAFLVGLAGYYWDVVSLRGVLDRPIPTLPTLLLQSAKRFIGLVVPTTAARILTDVRYLQKLGVPKTVAVAQGPLISVVGFAAEVTLLLLAASTIGQTLEFDDLGNGNAGTIIAVVVALVVIGIVILLAVPRLRERVVPWVRSGLASAAAVFRNPRRLGQIFLGQFLERLTGALALTATLVAFDQRLTFTAVIFVAVGTGLLAGLAPVPGGIGVAEATMTALLSSVGVPTEIAVSVAIVYRFLTSYLPPALGWFSLRWLTGNGFL